LRDADLEETLKLLEEEKLLAVHREEGRITLAKTLSAKKGCGLGARSTNEKKLDPAIPQS
jgi:hypothetical protein